MADRRWNWFGDLRIVGPYRHSNRDRANLSLASFASCVENKQALAIALWLREDCSFRFEILMRSAWLSSLLMGATVVAVIFVAGVLFLGTGANGLIGAAQVNVIRLLDDPGSAQFRDGGSHG